MPHQPRYIPEESTVFELTGRTVDGLMAFVPVPAVLAEWIGLLAEAGRRWPTVRLHQICVLSNHFHALSSVTGENRVNDRGHWASFVMAGAARIAQRYHRLTGRIWARRYSAIVVLDEAALRARVRYIMAQAVRAGLVPRPSRWPEVNCADALCRGALLRGYYTTAATRKMARRRGVSYAATGLPRRLKLAPLPGHTNWTEGKRHAWFRHIEREIIQEAALENRRYPSQHELITVSPTTTVALPSTPAPKAHVSPSNPTLRQAWITAKCNFVAAWRRALMRWVAGEPPRFPPGGWVPFSRCFKGLNAPPS